MSKKVQKQVDKVPEQPRSIILTPGQPPQFVGKWLIGEILSMSRSLGAWVESLPMGTPPEAEVEETLTED